MIKIKANPPERLRAEFEKLCLAAETAKEKAINSYRSDQSVKVKINAIYRKYKPFLQETHHHKCAYCESKLTDNSGDVEHYRPKGNVKDETGKAVTIQTDTGDLYKHPGYFWEAYRWGNLLLACKNCNSWNGHGKSSITGKYDFFPISGTRAFDPDDDLLLEDPLIINPILDDPRDHLTIDLSGLLKGKDEKGQYTIGLLALNRQFLKEGREDAICYGQDIITALMNANANQNVNKAKAFLGKLNQINTGEYPHALAAQLGLKNFYESQGSFGPQLQQTFSPDL